MSKKVAVAMSGGVDSSVAAALLKEDGYEVVGVYMQLRPEADYDIADLEHTCQLLDIPLHKINLETEFQSLVIDYFYKEYSLGYTPNPCVVCNRHIKFGFLLDRALQLGAEYLATGHYARIDEASDGYHLLKAVDENKDQSYFLYTLGQKQLQHLLLPIGAHYKEAIKNIAARMGLPIINRRESQDACFLNTSDYRSFIAEQMFPELGEIVDNQGNTLGKHQGLAYYTVGQRQGLGITFSRPLYVLKMDTTQNRLVVGTREQLLSNMLLANKLSWVSGQAPGEITNVTAKIRYRSSGVTAALLVKDEAAKIRFHQPQWAITPGQSVVFYQGEVLLGGGVITHADTFAS